MVDHNHSRRNVVRGIGTAIIAVGAAGCSSDDSTSTSGEPDESETRDSDGGSESEGEPETDEPDEADDDGSLVFEEHEFVVEEYSTRIEGIVRNDTGVEQSYVEVTATFYNEDNVRIGDSYTNTTDLPDGARWKFDIRVTTDAEDVDRYKVEATTGV